MSVIECIYRALLVFLGAYAITQGTIHHRRQRLNTVGIPSGSGRPGRREAGLDLSNSPGLGLPGPSYRRVTLYA